MLRRFSVLLSRRPSEAYRQLVAAGTISRDENQIQALPVFDRLYDDLTKYVEQGKRIPHPKRQIELQPPSRLGLVPTFFLRREQERKVNEALNTSGDSASNASYHPLSRVKGLYVWGGVGCGKTMLMDILYDNAPSEVKKMRIHFHQFMLDVQKTQHQIRFKSKEEVARQRNISSEERRRTAEAEIDLFDELAQRMVSNVELLCFDEVAVADVADAMIMKRLFNAFYRIGLVVIFTSNRPPDGLYLGGLNRGGFLPFIDLVNQQCLVYHMNSKTDHRLSGHQADTYIAPFSHENEEKFEKVHRDCCKGMPSEERVLKVFGRDVVVPRACGGVCYFYFSEICGTAMSTADYQVIAKTFHTVFINGVPRFPRQGNDVKNRFLVLIDTLYGYHCKVVIYAQAEPPLLQADTEEDAEQLEGGQEKQLRFDQLSEFERESGKRLIDVNDNSFQMERCISRLFEMRTKEYLESPHSFEEVDISTVV